MTEYIKIITFSNFSYLPGIVKPLSNCIVFEKKMFMVDVNSTKDNGKCFRKRQNVLKTVLKWKIYANNHDLWLD